jgi:hypothetical protein
MTPRALLTAIGSTAVAFAIAIGIAAGSGSSQVTPASASASSLQTTMSLQREVAHRTLQANQDCPFAV